MLNEKQELFAQEYIIDLNCTQAAIRAGYSEDSAGNQGHRLIKNDEISARIGELLDARAKRTMVTQDFVIEGLVDMVHRCKQAAPVMIFDPIEKSMVQATNENGQGVWEFDSNGANRAYELLGKHLALFTDKTQHTGELKGISIVIDGKETTD